MRVFHELVIDAPVTNASGFTSHFKFNQQLGAVDHFSISGYATQVTGGSPTLSVYTEHSFDQFTWFGRPTLISSLPLSLTGETWFQVADDNPDTSPKLPFVHVVVQLGGTVVVGVFRVWVTGRDYSRRARAIVNGASGPGAAQGRSLMASR